MLGATVSKPLFELDSGDSARAFVTEALGDLVDNTDIDSKVVDLNEYPNPEDNPENADISIGQPLLGVETFNTLDEGVLKISISSITKFLETDFNYPPLEEYFNGDNRTISFEVIPSKSSMGDSKCQLVGTNGLKASYITPLIEAELLLADGDGIISVISDIPLDVMIKQIFAILVSQYNK